MTSQDTRRIAIATLAGLAAGLLSSPAMALEQAVDEVVPAAACEPLADPHKVELHDGSWRFQGTETGLVSFYCPIRVSHFYTHPSLGTFDNTAQAVFMDFYDPDKVGSTHYVEGMLHRSMETWPFANTVGVALDSVPDFGDNTVDECLASFDCDEWHSVARAKYYVRVDMYRGSTNDGPRLTAVGLSWDVPG